jgi:thioester reductase-like protein
LHSYEQLKAANVLGTVDILRLCCLGGGLPLHYVSTISVFADPEIELIAEDDLPTSTAGLSSGYSQSKWVAERIVLLARERGLPVAIYRPGTVSGHSRTGISNPKDFMGRVLQSCIELGCIPVDNAGQQVNLAPVDYVSAAIVQLAQQPAALGRTYHLVNPASTSLGDVLRWLAELGYPLQQVRYAEWRAALATRAAETPAAAIGALLALFPERSAEDEARVRATGRTSFSYAPILQEHAQTDLAAAGIACPTVDVEVIRRYLHYLASSGLIPPAVQPYPVT